MINELSNEAKILLLEILLDVEQERSIRNYNAALFFEQRYNELVDWLDEEDE